MPTASDIPVLMWDQDKIREDFLNWCAERLRNGWDAKRLRHEIESSPDYADYIEIGDVENSDEGETTYQCWRDAVLIGIQLAEESRNAK